MAGPIPRLRSKKAAGAFLLLGVSLLAGCCEALLTACLAIADEALPPPREVVDEYLKLITARPVSVDVLRESSAPELPYAHVRLFVAATVHGPTLHGIDSQVFRATGRVSRIELPLPDNSFRDLVVQTLRASSPSSRLPCDADIRTIDVWCRNAGVPGVYQPMLIKVWDDPRIGEQTAGDAPRKILGRLCPADIAFLTECQGSFDYQPTVIEGERVALVAAPGLEDAMADAVGKRRELLEILANRAGEAIQKESVPVPGGVLIELKSLVGLPSTTCHHQGTTTRVADDRAFLALQEGVLDGSCTLSFSLPFPIGAAAMRGLVETTDCSSSVEIETSVDGGTWTKVFSIVDRPTRVLDQWIVPATQPGTQSLHIRLRLASAAGSGSRAGPRVLGHRLAVPVASNLVDTEGVLRLVEIPQPLPYASAKRPPLQLTVQRDRISADGLVAMVREDRNGTVDVYVPCDLDEAACDAIARYEGTIRFWAHSSWHDEPPSCLDRLVAGRGSIMFPRLRLIPLPLAKVVGNGQKSLSFPAVTEADPEVLRLVADCSGELSLDGIERLSLEQSAAVAPYRGPRLSLAAARHIRFAGDAPEPFLRAAVETPGTLALEGLETIDEPLANILASGRKHLLLNAVSRLTPEVLAVLALTRGGMSLDGLSSLAPDCARELLAYNGPFLTLRGLRRVECHTEDLLTLRSRTSSPPRLASLLQPRPAAATADRTRFGSDSEGLRDTETPELGAPPISEAGSSEPEVSVFEAFLRSPGTLRLDATRRGGNEEIPLDAATATRLAQGLKNLDLVAFSTMNPEVFKALCQSKQMISFGGLKNVPQGCLPDLCNYPGPMAFLDGVRALDKDSLTSLLPMIENDRISLTGAKIYNIEKLRAETDRLQKQKPGVMGEDAQRFLDRSDSEEWTGTMGRLDVGRARVVRIWPDNVEFRVGKDETFQRDRNTLSDNSRNKLDLLSRLADEVAKTRKAILLMQR